MSTAPFVEPLKHLSAATSSVVAGAAPSIVAVHSHRARSSGFIWRPGLIVTADEALSDDGEIAVVLIGGERVLAKVAGRDPTTDIALLRAETGDGPAVVFNGAIPAAGALAIAVGAYDGAPTAALGIVAASGPAWRSMRGGDIDARIDLDLSLRRHAEGGVALDTDGRVFGMTVFGPRRRVLVIPVATIARVADKLETHGRIARGYLGLGLRPIRLDRDGGFGAMVTTVDADGPGAKAGVHQGDIIVAWHDEPIDSVHALLRALGPESVGKNVTLSVRRGAETRPVILSIGERP